MGHLTIPGNLFFATFYTLHRTISYKTHLECFKPLPLKKTQKKSPCVHMCIGCHGLSQDTKQGEGSLLWQLLALRNWQDSKSTCEMWENPIPCLECGRWYVHETPRTCNMYLLKYLFMQIFTQQKSLNTPHQLLIFFMSPITLWLPAF